MKNAKFQTVKQALKNNENMEETLSLAKTLNPSDIKELPLADFQELINLTYSAEFKAQQNKGIKRILGKWDTKKLMDDNYQENLHRLYGGTRKALLNVATKWTESEE